MTADKVIFSGCSYTAGDGWQKNTASADPNSPYLWINLCHTRIEKLNNLKLINIGSSGASNTEIFENTIRAISQYQNSIHTIFCQWTGMPRYRFNIGLELWDTLEDLYDVRAHDVKLANGTTWHRKYIRDVINRLKAMHHMHWDIVKVVDYSNIIYNMAKCMNIDHVFFVNGVCPWDQNYFIELHNVDPTEYTHFTKKYILESDHRSTQDNQKLYSTIHQHYRSAGGIKQQQWISLQKSFHDQQIDTNYDNQHPGIKSNELYYKLIEQHLAQLNFL